jgi:general secretion pathway protein J
MKKTQGFTLLEVLVALGIVAVISILSWQGLQEVLRSTQRVSAVDEQVQTVSAVFAQLAKDLDALELDLTGPSPDGDLIETTGNGLLMRFTRRDTSEPAYREQVEWILNENGLLRIATRELSPDQPSVTPPIAIKGLRVRLLREPGGWSTPVTVGQVVAQPFQDINLQGPPVQLNNTPAPPNAGENPPPTAPLATQGLVRAVELGLTQMNNQTVTRVFLTGGVY